MPPCGSIKTRGGRDVTSRALSSRGFQSAENLPGRAGRGRRQPGPRGRRPPTPPRRRPPARSPRRESRGSRFLLRWAAPVEGALVLLPAGRAPPNARRRKYSRLTPETASQKGSAGPSPLASQSDPAGAGGTWGKKQGVPSAQRAAPRPARPSKQLASELALRTVPRQDVVPATACRSSPR
jgi:hypothetical protein